MRTLRAFTLVEFLITLTVIGILALIVMPGFYAFAQRQALRNTAQQVAMDLRLAKSHAINSAKPVYVTFNTDRQAWCYAVIAGELTPDKALTYECGETGGSLKNAQAANFHHIELLRASFSGDNYLGFEPMRGMPIAHGQVRTGAIWLRNATGQRMAIVVSRIGRVRVCEEGRDNCPKPPV